MAGVTLDVKIEDREVRELFLGLARRMDDATPAMAEIGEIVIESVQRNFEESRSPEGKAWKPLARSTVLAKIRRGRSATDILIDKGPSGGLLGSLSRRASRDRVAVGVNKIYAAVHQFGAAFSTIKGRRTVIIPARPYLGVRETDWPEIKDTLARYVLEGR